MDPAPADALVPPTDLLFDGTTSPEEFKQTGEGFVRHFLVGRAGLGPDEKVLDVGCGVGQKARPLATYLSPAGSYDGFDIVPAGIRWCQEAYAPFPNFRFQLADLSNTHYRPEGGARAEEYVFPYEDARFDVVFLSSVFTHLLPRQVENYLREISRVLAPGGRCVITFFLLNGESKRRIEGGQSSMAFPHAHETGQCRVQDRRRPETAVAYEETFARDLHDRLGLTVVEVSYGFWCGRKDLHGCLQDVVLSLKEPPTKDPAVAGLRSLGAAIRRGLGRRLE